MRSPSIGSLIAALAAVMLVVSLFLDWFEPGFSAWTSFEVWDIVLAAIALAALARLAHELGAFRPGERVPLGPLAAIALVVVVVSLVNHPPAAIGRDLAAGAWLALAAVVLLALGALLAEARLTVRLDVDRSSPPRASAPAAGPTTPLAEPTAADTGTTRLQR